MPFSCLVRQQRGVFKVWWPTACLPLGCFTDADLATVSTLAVLANPSATRAVGISLRSPVQPSSLLCDTQEPCCQHIVRAHAMQQLNKCTPGHGLQLLLIARHHKATERNCATVLMLAAPILRPSSQFL